MRYSGSVLALVLLLAACTTPLPPAAPTPAPLAPPSASSPEPPVASVISPVAGERAADPSPRAEEADTPSAVIAPSTEDPGAPSAATSPEREATVEPASSPAPVAVSPVPVASPGTTVNPYAQPSVGGPPALVNPYAGPAAASATGTDARAVGVPFLQAVLRRDLAAARSFYPPDALPEGWGAIIPGEASSGTSSDFSACRGSDPVISEVPASATRQTMVFRFPTECALMPALSAANPNQTLQRFNGLSVRLELIENRWWVTGLGAFRAVG